MSSLGEEYPKAQARLRVIVMCAKEIGPAGAFLATIGEDCLRRADKAAIEQDTVAMIRIYQEMMDFKE